MLATKSSFKSPQTRFNLLLLEDGEFFLDVRFVSYSPMRIAFLCAACLC
jgi:hypothetical protein